MFTFSPGFEAATLKIPNKEYTAYGLPLSASASQSSGQQRGGYNAYAGSNDPYNLVTVNQGGVVVDAGRDGIASWPAAPPAPPSDTADPNANTNPSTAQQQSQQQQSHFAIGGNPMGAGGIAPRKQIIGFAKFRTREEALGARDVLQGRRVDIDKGAVLKAEMAKKNLHTKRGVGPVGGAGGGMGPNAGGMGMNGGPPLNGMGGPGLNGGGMVGGMMGEMYAEALSPSQREAGAIGAMGLPPNNANASNINNGGNPNSNPNNNNNNNLANGRMAQWRSESQIALALEEEEAAMQMHEAEQQRERERERRQQGVLSAMGLRGPRERAEEERMRGERERDSAQGMEGERERARRDRERRVGVAFEAFSALGRDSRPQAQRDEGEYVQGPWDGVRLGGGMQSASRRSSSPDTTYANANGGGGYAMANGVGAPFAGEVPRAFSSPPPGEYAPHVHHGLPPSHYVPLGYGQGQYPPFMQHETYAQEQQDLQQQHQQHGYQHPHQHQHQHRQGRSDSSASEGSVSELDRGLARLAVRNATAASPNVLGHAPPSNAPIAIPGNGGNSGGSGSGSGSGGGSPQLASPASSGAGRAVDQNPPINTLYVGNLPALPAAGGAGLTMEHLEAALRELFGGCAGFRQMSFRPKGNGPMCFVEVCFAFPSFGVGSQFLTNDIVRGRGLRDKDVERAVREHAGRDHQGRRHSAVV